MNYIAVRGKGNPNDGYFDYVVPPLEGFWWMEGKGREASFLWEN